MSNWIVPVALLGLLFLFTRRKGEKGPSSPDEIKEGLARVIDLYGPSIARNVERMYRLETDNFTSGGFQATKSAGQKAFSAVYPFGWPVRFTNASMFLAPVTMVDNIEGTMSMWVAWKRFADAAQYLGAFLHSHGNNPGRWKTNVTANQGAYNAAVASMPSTFVDQLTSPQQG